MYSGSEADLQFLGRQLAAGELVAIPTETVYGLAAHALDENACRRIFEVKGRPLIDPLIVHIGERDQLGKLALPNEHAERVADAFWPGPLTMVLPKRSCVPAIVTAGLDTVAIRMPSHTLARALLRTSGLPLAAPSANPFGYVSPTRAEHVAKSLGNRVRHILDGGACTIGLESTIVDLSRPEGWSILRPGAITRADLESVIGISPTEPKHSAKSDQAQTAPGMLARHYSPRATVFLSDELPRHVPDGHAAAATAFVHHQRPMESEKRGNDFWLSETGDPADMGRHLYDLLRRLDQEDFTAICIARVPEKFPLAGAINDRLRRSAARD